MYISVFYHQHPSKLFFLLMSSRHIIIEFLIHYRTLYEDVLSPYSYNMDLL
jgi:hypothetical protein